MPTSEGLVYNDNVAGLAIRIDRFMVELIKSTSANVSEFVEPDTARLESYRSELVGYLDWVVAQPMMDYPETHPMGRTLSAPMTIPEITNPMVKDAIWLLERLRGELVNGESARRASGLIKFDENRARAVLERMKAFLEDYVANYTPVDMPESSPAAAMTGPGLSGA